MSELKPPALMFEINRLKQDINDLVRSFNTAEGSVLFEELSLRQPARFIPAELGFVRSVSWLYGLYFESGRVGVTFLCERLNTYSLDDSGQCRNHLQIVRHLRTFLQHNLNLMDSQDLNTRENCEQWLKRKCGTAVPDDEDQWSKCLISLLEEAKASLETFLACVRCIETDNACEVIIVDLRFYQRRHHHSHEFKRLVEVAASDMGQEYIDATKLTSRFYEKWRKDLENLTGSYDFNREGRKLVEQTLLAEGTIPLPITGEDIMHEFGIAPGIEVRHYLDRAKKLFETQPCTREKLLQNLRERFESEPGLPE